ncbi:hypothetical protein DICA4_C06986 [Diutina catenulata]
MTPYPRPSEGPPRQEYAGGGSDPPSAHPFIGDPVEVENDDDDDDDQSMESFSESPPSRVEPDSAPEPLNVVPLAPGANSAAPGHPDPVEVPSHLPMLVRRTSIHPQCYHDYPELEVQPVKLNFVKNIGDVTENWSADEHKNHRRIVEFSAARGPSPWELSLTYQTVAHPHCDPASVAISCIWWQEMGLHIVTSVDIILLLEHLVRQSFTIEEKNRIRRNLQSLKPYTVARTNPRFLPFFNIIMEMEDPRPRNIEKDIKVFKWADLGLALDKVLFKYTWNVPQFQFYLMGSESEMQSFAAPPPVAHQPNDFVGNERVASMRAHVPSTFHSGSSNSSRSSGSIPPKDSSGPSGGSNGNSDDGKRSGDTTVSNSTSSDDDSSNGVSSTSSSTGFSMMGASTSSGDSEPTSVSSKDTPVPSHFKPVSDDLQPSGTRFGKPGPSPYYQLPSGQIPQGPMRYDSGSPLGASMNQSIPLPSTDGKPSVWLPPMRPALSNKTTPLPRLEDTVGLPRLSRPKDSPSPQGSGPWPNFSH